MAETPRDYDFTPSFRPGGMNLDATDSAKYLPPGSPAMPAPGADAAFSGMLGQFSPLMASISKLAGLDQRIVDGLTQSLGGLLSTRGSFTRPTNFADIMSNSAVMNQNRDMLQNFETSLTAAQNRMTGQMLEKMGYTTGSSAYVKALAATEVPGNLVGIASDALFKGYGFDQMRRSFTASALLGGVGLGPDATERQGRFGAFASTLAASYAENKFAFGGLSGGDVGQLQTAMVQRGQLDFRGGTETAVQMRDKVKRMAQALGPMKELFNESIPELMNRLDSAFGVSAATFSPDQISTKVLQMKNTARLTGVSVQTLMDMSQGAQQMLGSMGMSGMGADTAAAQAAGMMGSGVNLARLNPAQFRRQVLRDTVGQQASQAAREMSGAAAILMRSGKYKSNQDAVNALIKQAGGDLSLENLAKITGATTGQIVGAGMSETAEDIRTQTDIATNLTGSRYDDFKMVAAQNLEYRARFSADPKMKKAYRLLADRLGKDGAALDERGATAALKSLGLSGAQLEAVLGTYRAEGDIAAGAVGFEGGMRGASAQMQAERNRAVIATRVNELTGMEKKFQEDEEAQKYGLLGMITGEGTTVITGEGTTVADFVKNAIGGRTVINRKTVEAMSPGSVRRANAMFREMYTNINRTDLDPQTKQRYKALQAALGATGGTPESRARAVEAASNAIFFEDTAEGQAVDKAAGFAGEKTEAFRKEYLGATDPEKHRMLKMAAMTKTLSGLEDKTLLSKFEDYKTKNAGKQINLREFLRGTGAEDETISDIEGKLEARAAEVGLDMSRGPVDYLKIIVELLQGILPDKGKETKGDAT